MAMNNNTDASTVSQIETSSSPNNTPVSQIDNLTQAFSRLEVQVPSLFESLSQITLDDLVSQHLLEVNTKIHCNINKSRYDGKVKRIPDGRVVLYSPEHSTGCTTPYEFIKLKVGKDAAKGRSWQCIKTESGTTLKSLKTECLRQKVSAELMKIPGVFGVSPFLIKQPPNPVYGFRVSVDAALNLDQIKQEYPALNDPAIQLILQERPNLKAEGVALGSKLGEGTLGVFCKDHNGTHYAVTAAHVSHAIDTSQNVCCGDLQLSYQKHTNDVDAALFRVESGTPLCHISSLAPWGVGFPQSIAQAAQPDPYETEDEELLEEPEGPEGPEGEVITLQQVEEVEEVEESNNNAEQLTPTTIQYARLELWLQSSFIRPLVWKLGQKTGLTCGILESVARLETPGTSPRRADIPVVKVQPLDINVVFQQADEKGNVQEIKCRVATRFSDAGDSGSLYWIDWRVVDSSYKFVTPLAIHLEGSKFLGVGMRLDQVFKRLGKFLHLCPSLCSSNSSSNNNNDMVDLASENPASDSSDQDSKMSRQALYWLTLHK